MFFKSGTLYQTLTFILIPTEWKNYAATLTNDSNLMRDQNFIFLDRVVQKVDNTIFKINHYPADSAVCFVNTYPLDSDLSSG